MTTISVTIPDAQTQRVINAICGLYRYEEYIADPDGGDGEVIPNPETKAQFAKRQLIGWVRGSVVSWEATLAANAARDAATDDAGSIQYT